MVSSPDQVPMPARIAARPRDERGYPVPAITPWPDGSPAFAQQGSFRTMICLAERRCTICGTKMRPGPVYRVVSDDLVDNIALALDAGKRYMNLAPAFEGPGHLICMLYSAIVCPYLASPGARRQSPTTVAGEHIPRGDPRGTEGAVVGFDSYRWQIRAGADGIEIFFGQPVDMLSYANGDDLAEELAAVIAREPNSAEQCPDYLLGDDSKAENAAKAVIESRGGPPPASSRQADQARKKQRKAARAARRKSRLCVTRRPSSADRATPFATKVLDEYARRVESDDDSTRAAP